MNKFDVETKVGGILYKAIAFEERGMLTVSSPTLGSKHAKIYSETKFLAKQLLAELIGEHLRNDNG